MMCGYLRSEKRFKGESLKRQREFSEEIKRITKQYFVQTPCKSFPIENNIWLPLISWLPRNLLIPMLRFTNLFWIKKTSPDWHLLSKKQMQEMFNGAEILEEKSFGLTKSLMAVCTLS